MSVVIEARNAITKDWQSMAITSIEYHQYLAIADCLGESHATSTYMLSRMIRRACGETRKFLRRMEKLGYVLSDSNGSNNIYWRLKP